MGALIIGEPERAIIRALQQRAAAVGPFDAKEIVEKISDPTYEADYRKTMNTLTIHLPVDFQVTYSLEKQPIGLCRHLSVSVKRRGKLPNMPAVAMIADAFGFQVPIEPEQFWLEPIDGGQAVNIVQPVVIPREGTA